MTRNQLTYHANLETERANKAKEYENIRSNLAKEKETNRSNLVREAETQRTNQANERIKAWQVGTKAANDFLGNVASAARTVIPLL